MILYLLPIAILALPIKHIFPVEGQPFIEKLDQRMKIDKNDVFDVEPGFTSETQLSNLSTSLFQNIANLNIIDLQYTYIPLAGLLTKNLFIVADKDNTYQYGFGYITVSGQIQLVPLIDLKISQKTNSCSGFIIQKELNFQFVCGNHTSQTIYLFNVSYRHQTQEIIEIPIPIQSTTQIYFYQISDSQENRESLASVVIIFTFENNSYSKWRYQLQDQQLNKLDEIPSKIFQFENNDNVHIVSILTDDQFNFYMDYIQQHQILGEFEQFTTYLDIQNKTFRIALISRDKVTFLYIDLQQKEIPYNREDKAFEKNQITSSNSQIFLNNDYLIVTNDVAASIYEYKGDITLKYQFPTQQGNKAIFIDLKKLIMLRNTDGTIQNIQIDQDIILYTHQVNTGLNGSFQLSTIDSQNLQTIQYQYTTLNKNDYGIQTLQNTSFSESNTYPFVIIRENDILYGPNITINGLQNVPETHKIISRPKVTRTTQNLSLMNQFITFDKDLQQYLAATIQDLQIYFSLMKLDLMNNTLKITNITQFSQTKDIQNIQFLKQGDGKYLVFATSISEIEYYKIFTNETLFAQSQSLSTIKINFEGTWSLQLVVSMMSLKILRNYRELHYYELQENDTYDYISKLDDIPAMIASDQNYNDVLYITMNNYLFLMDILDSKLYIICGHEFDIRGVYSTQIGFMKEGIFLFQQAYEEQYLSFITKQSLNGIQMNRIPRLQGQTFSSSSIYTYTEKFFYNVQEVQGNQELVIYQVQPSSFNMIYQSIYFEATIKQISCSTNSLEQYDLCIVIFSNGQSEQVIIMHEYILLRNQTYQQCETPQSIYNALYSELTIICSNNSYVYDLKTQTDTDLNETNSIQQIALSASNQNGTVNSSIQLNFVSLSDKTTTSSALTIIIILLVSVIVVVAATTLFYMRRKSLLLKQNNVLPEENPKTDRYSESRI